MTYFTSVVHPFHIYLDFPEALLSSVLQLVHRKYGGGARPVGNASEEGRVTVDAEDGAGPSKRAKISQVGWLRFGIAVRLSLW